MLSVNVAGGAEKIRVTVAAMRVMGKPDRRSIIAKPLSGKAFFGLSTIAVDKPVRSMSNASLSGLCHNIFAGLPVC